MAITKQCPICGQIFQARNDAQKCCSQKCTTAANRERKKQQRDFRRAIEPIIEVSHQDYLTFSKAAVLMGCSRQYIYKLVAQGKLPASRLSSRMALVRKADIEKMLDASPYERVLPSNKIKFQVKSTSANQTTSPVQMDEHITHYSGEEIISIYKVKRSWLHTAARKHHIPTCRIAGKVYFSKQHVDEYFYRGFDLSTVKEWITQQEAATTYNLTIGSIRSYVYRHQIPSKRENGQLYYSASHLEASRQTDLFNGSSYYTVEEVQSKYGLSKANINKIAIQKGIRKVKVGTKNLLLIEDVERVMAERAAQGLPVLMK